nr:MAG TPA: hypothetical protein [Caudoviricetes sp.]
MDIYTYDGKALQYNGKCISPKASDETWVLNEDVPPRDLVSITFNVKFISNKISFQSITNSMSSVRPVLYDDTPVFAGRPVATWVDQAYRTITFLETPTGDLLTWLQANGIKQ